MDHSIKPFPPGLVQGILSELPFDIRDHLCRSLLSLVEIKPSHSQSQFKQSPSSHQSLHYIGETQHVMSKSRFSLLLSDQDEKDHGDKQPEYYQPCSLYGTNNSNSIYSQYDPEYHTTTIQDINHLPIEDHLYLPFQDKQHAEELLSQKQKQKEEAEKLKRLIISNITSSSTVDLNGNNDGINLISTGTMIGFLLSPYLMGENITLIQLNFGSLSLDELFQPAIQSWQSIFSNLKPLPHLRKLILNLGTFYPNAPDSLAIMNTPALETLFRFFSTNSPNLESLSITDRADILIPQSYVQTLIKTTLFENLQYLHIDTIYHYREDIGDDCDTTKEMVLWMEKMKKLNTFHLSFSSRQQKDKFDECLSQSTLLSQLKHLQLGRSHTRSEYIKQMIESPFFSLHNNITSLTIGHNTNYFSSIYSQLFYHQGLSNLSTLEIELPIDDEMIKFICESTTLKQSQKLKKLRFYAKSFKTKSLTHLSTTPAMSNLESIELYALASIDNHDYSSLLSLIDSQFLTNLKHLSLPWDKFGFRSYNNDDGDDDREELLLEKLRNSKNLSIIESITINNATKVDERLIEVLLQLPNLRKIHIHGGYEPDERFEEMNDDDIEGINDDDNNDIENNDDDNNANQRIIYAPFEPTVDDINPYLHIKRALMTIPRQSKIKELDISGCCITDDDLDFLTMSPIFDQLIVLKLDSNPITGRGLMYICQSLPMSNLVSLSLLNNPRITSRLLYQHLRSAVFLQSLKSFTFFPINIKTMRKVVEFDGVINPSRS